jgi:hypothetical protein
MLTPEVVRPYAISGQSSETIGLASQPQWSNAVLVSICSLALAVLLSWHTPTFLSLIALVPIVLFRLFSSFIPTAIVAEQNCLRIHYRRFFGGVRTESYSADEISGFDGTPYTFRGHYAAVKMIRADGTIKTLFSGPRGNRDLAAIHSAIVAEEFSRILGCNTKDSRHTG